VGRIPIVTYDLNALPIDQSVTLPKDVVLERFGLVAYPGRHNKRIFLTIQHLKIILAEHDRISHDHWFAKTIPFLNASQHR